MQRDYVLEYHRRFPQSNSVDVAEGVTEIYYSAFEGMDWLKEIYLPKSLERICQNAFLKCRNLERVYVSSEMNCVFEKYAFGYCTNLSYMGPKDNFIKGMMSVPSGVTLKNAVFQGVQATYLIYFPYDITWTDDSGTMSQLVLGCRKLQLISVPSQDRLPTFFFSQEVMANIPTVKIDRRGLAFMPFLPSEYKINSGAYGLNFPCGKHVRINCFDIVFSRSFTLLLFLCFNRNARDPNKTGYGVPSEMILKILSKMGVVIADPFRDCKSIEPTFKVLSDDLLWLSNYTDLPISWKDKAKKAVHGLTMF